MSCPCTLSAVFLSLDMQLQFTVVNKAEENITISDKTGTWKMDFPIESDDSQPQVAMTYNKEKTLIFNASSQDGSQELLINGQKEFVLDPNTATGLKGFVVHKEGTKMFSLLH